MVVTEFLNQYRMNGGLTRIKIRCAMLRHAETPKGSRQAPIVYRRVHSSAHHTAGAGRLLTSAFC
jgi:hypothetical protein